VCVIGDDGSIDNIIGHFDALRSSTQYADAMHVVFIESNLMATWSHRISRLLLDRYRSNMLIPSFDSSKEHRPGVWTSARSKDSGVVRTEAMLRDEQFAFAEEFLTATKRPPRVTLAAHKAMMKKMLCDELRNYKAITAKPINVHFGKFKAVLTGKGNGLKDDCSTSLHQLVERMEEVLSDTQFVKWLRDNGKAA
jgi:hypothetical protein